ncbi:hypothetical protein ACQPXB_09065 [Amycolatopsis sp. CA-161197]|uniref:hypothetical protein n=1 Tax=Amycolatopsis sp. CA-161197 TaxID=3239922 RepID=UPI003D8F546F
MIGDQSDANALVDAQRHLAYHQIRVLLLVRAVAKVAGNANKLDGLTKLAKLDFLVRYPALAQKVVSASKSDPRMFPTVDDKLEAESPMIRYKYGPWDHTYYPVIGALVGKGLVSYVKNRKGSVALRPTRSGNSLAKSLEGDQLWVDLAARCTAVAEHAGGFSGSQLKELIYENLPEVVSLAHGEVIRR